MAAGQAGGAPQQAGSGGSLQGRELAAVDEQRGCKLARACALGDNLPPTPLALFPALLPAAVTSPKTRRQAPGSPHGSPPGSPPSTPTPHPPTHTPGTPLISQAAPRQPTIRPPPNTPPHTPQTPTRRPPPPGHSPPVNVSHVEWPMKMSDRSGATLTRALHLPLSATCSGWVGGWRCMCVAGWLAGWRGAHGWRVCVCVTVWMWLEREEGESAGGREAALEGGRCGCTPAPGALLTPPAAPARLPCAERAALTLEKSRAAAACGSNRAAASSAPQWRPPLRRCTVGMGGLQGGAGAWRGGERGDMVWVWGVGVGEGAQPRLPGKRASTAAPAHAGYKLVNPGALTPGPAPSWGAGRAAASR